MATTGGLTIQLNSDELLITGTTITASNGLSRIGNDIRWGGGLVSGGTTVISGNSNIYFGSTNDLSEFLKIFSLNTTEYFQLTNYQIGHAQNQIFSYENGLQLARATDDNTCYNTIGMVDEYVQINGYRNNGATSIRVGGGIGDFLITDGRTGNTKTGIEYAEDYSSHYTDRSLVDKGYVQAEFGKLKSYAKASLPSASPAGKLIFVTNDIGGSVPAFSDGTNWRRVTDRNVIS